jgi:hypothetical protein
MLRQHKFPSCAECGFPVFWGATKKKMVNIIVAAVVWEK